MKILFSPFSPYVRKCMVVAHELGLDGRIELLASSAHPVNRDRQIIATNPLGKVPTFYTDDGQVLYDSRVICEYLDNLQGGSLFPAAGRDRWTALTLQSLGDGVLDAALLARYEDTTRPEAFRWNDWKLAQMDKFETALAALDAAPGQLADRVNVGTLTIGCALWYLDLRFADFAWRDRHTQVARWYEQFRQRPSMSATWSLGSA
jgi:glutathione S-transferase